MSMCFASGCYHRALHDMCHFFRFPKDKQQFKIWREFCKKPNKEPKYDSSRLCSCHFVDGIKANGPTIFPEAVKEAPNSKFFERRKRGKTSSVNALPIKKTGKPLRTRASTLKLSLTSLKESPSGDNNESSDPAHNQPPSTDSGVTNELDKLKEQLAEAQMKIDLLETELALKTFQHLDTSETTFSYLMLEPDFRLFHYYTGLPSGNVFKSLLEGISKDKLNYHDSWVPLKMSLADQLLATLMKLRLNFDFTDLSVRFNVSQGTIRNVFLTLIYELHALLYPNIKMGAHRNTNTEGKSLSNCKCIIDFVEIECSPSISTIRQAKIFSHFKQKNIFKGLLACSPQGEVTFISNLFPGSTSDKEVFQESGIMENLVEGDLILSDKGLLISDILPPGVVCYIPPVIKTTMSNETENIDSNEITEARIHVKRIISRMKMHRILDCIPDHLRSHASIIFQVIGCLISLHHPLIEIDSSLFGGETDYESEM